MKGNIHTKFILTPIIDILNETVISCRCLGKGIETQSLCEYVMQTTFLKMTGASEQKLKCICWEMATYDYYYRYKKLTKPLGECSCYDEKKAIFTDMLEVIGNIDSSYNFDNLFTRDKKEGICENIKSSICSSISGTIIENWESRSFLLYNKDPLKFANCNLFANKQQETARTPYGLFEKVLKDYYENVVYRHRNRCAHNLKSYQNNLPTFSMLEKPDYEYENYFHIFSVLILLDEIYISIYKEYLQLLKDYIS